MIRDQDCPGFSAVLKVLSVGPQRGQVCNKNILSLDVCTFCCEVPNPKFPPSSAKVVFTLYLYIQSTSFGVRDNRTTQPPTHFINSTEVWALSQKFLEMVEFFFLPRLTLSILRPLVSEMYLTPSFLISAKARQVSNRN